MKQAFIFYSADTDDSDEFSSAIMSQTVISNDHHFKVQRYILPLVQIDFM